jgi:hypothetical protein
MQRLILVLALAAACATASAADAPQPQPAAGNRAFAAAKATGLPLATVLASPSILRTTAVVQPDGSVALVCDQVRNPHPGPVTIHTPAPVPQQ